MVISISCIFARSSAFSSLLVSSRSSSASRRALVEDRSALSAMTSDTSDSMLNGMRDTTTDGVGQSAFHKLPRGTLTSTALRLNH